MNANYQTARQAGLLPPLAACVAVWQTTPTLAAQIRTLHPTGAAVVFLAAYIAGLAGSLAAAGIVAAFLAGLYLVKVQASSPRPMGPPPVKLAGSVPSSPQPAAIGNPLADMLGAAGLAVSQVTLKQPSANGKAPKTTTATK